MVMVWHTSRGLTAGVAAITVVRALIPAATIWLTKLVIDAVVEAIAVGGTDGSVNRVVTLVVLQLVLALLATALDHGGNTMRTLLGDRFSNRINIMILEKAETLDLAYFEDSKFYDMLERARREANMRPAGLVTNTFQLAGSFIQLLSIAALLASLAWWILLVVAVTSIPYLGADMWFARARHRLMWRRAPESRRLWYLGYVMTSDETVKEVRLFDLGGHLLDQYRSTFARFYRENRKLTPFARERHLCPGHRVGGHGVRAVHLRGAGHHRGPPDAGRSDALPPGAGANPRPAAPNLRRC